MNIGRSQTAFTVTQLFLGIFCEALTFDNISSFAVKAKDSVREQSRLYSEYYAGNEDILTDHADHIRTLLSKIQQLEEILPRLEIDRRNILLFVDAVGIMGFIYAGVYVMQLKLHDRG